MKTARRAFFRQSTLGLAAMGWLAETKLLQAQIAGERPKRNTQDVAVLNPLNRIPVGLIIDDSTCLVNLNRFAMPQFDAAFGGANSTYHRNWRDWPPEIPDAFVRKFGEWCSTQGVKGKFSVVPYPACVGRLDRQLPGWSQRELSASIDLVRALMTPNWDIHPEMVTHTRVIDLKTGHPYPEFSLKFMENWDWTTGRSVAEIAEYMTYALRILQNIGLTCEGITTPGGFGNRALPQLAQATLESVREVFKAEIPHYFRHVYDKGHESVAPRVEYAADLEGPNPRCVVSIIGCTGDWTGGWDNSEPVGADAFITPDLQKGRMIDVIQRGEPVLMLAHWTGIYWNGQERGFKIFQEVVRRLKMRFDNLIWMKLGEVARYWAAKELTRLEQLEDRIELRAPFATPRFTIAFPRHERREPRLSREGSIVGLREVSNTASFASGTWMRQGERTLVCFDLQKGSSTLLL